MTEIDRSRLSESAYLLQRAVEKSKRTSGVQLPIGFFRASDVQAVPPVALMLRGGRGGALRIKIYLCVCMVATQAPHIVHPPTPARVWAEMLDLPNPEINGARRVGDALLWLSSRGYVKLQRTVGAPPVIELRSAIGNGKKFTRPIGRYVSIPLGLWRYEWITALSGRGLAVLLDLLDLQGGRAESNPPSMSLRERSRYGISQDTWTRGERELMELGLLTVRRAPQGEAFDWRRMRNTYWVHIERLNAPQP